MGTFLYYLLGFSYIFLFIWGLFLARNHRFLHLTNVLLIIILGLVYDNLIMASGKFIGEGNLLEGLNAVRFWIHALITPTLVLFAWSIYHWSDLPGSKGESWKTVAYLTTAGLIVYELFASVIGLKLEPTWTNGVLTYESVGQSTSPLMVIIITGILGMIGLLLLIKYRFYWLLMGTLIMFSGGLLAIWIKDFPIMNVLEILLIVSLLLTKKFFLEKQTTKKDSSFSEL